MADEKERPDDAAAEEQHELPTYESNNNEETTILSRLLLTDQYVLSYAGIFCSGLVLLVALVSNDLSRNHQYYEYGISIAVVAMVFALALWGMGAAQIGSDTITVYLNGFVFVWCFVGACFMTFGGPFKVSGNGFFASYGLVISSVLGLGVGADNVKETATKLGGVLGLLVSSIVTVVAISSEWGDSYKSELIYGLVVAIFTIVVTGLLLATAGRLNKIKFFVLLLFACLWIVLACLLTFRGPFITTGNGYFAVWLGCVMSIVATVAAKEEMNE